MCQETEGHPGLDENKIIYSLQKIRFLIWTALSPSRQWMVKNKKARTISALGQKACCCRNQVDVTPSIWFCKPIHILNALLHKISVKGVSAKIVNWDDMQVLVLLYVLSEAKRLQSVSKKTINITAKNHFITCHAKTAISVSSWDEWFLSEKSKKAVKQHSLACRKTEGWTDISKLVQQSER